MKIYFFDPVGCTLYSVGSFHGKWLTNRMIRYSAVILERMRQVGW